eukprot:6066436-Pyramimonas_sp.AAC.1
MMCLVNPNTDALLTFTRRAIQSAARPITREGFPVSEITTGSPMKQLKRLAESSCNGSDSSCRDVA